MDGLVNEALPSGWAKTTLGAVAGGPRARVAADTKSSLPFVGLEHIAPGALRPHAFGRFADMRSAASPFSAGDVLYARMRPYLNKVWCADREGVASAEFLVFPNSGRVHPDFLALLLHHQSFVEFARHASSGDRPRVEWADIAKYPIWLPPYDEQTRIIFSLNNFFDEVNAGEAALARAHEGLTEFRASLLHAACTGALTADWRFANMINDTGSDLLAAVLHRSQRLQENDKKMRSRRSSTSVRSPEVAVAGDLPPLPVGWAWTTVSKLSLVSGGLTKNASRNGSPMQLPYLRVANVGEDRIDLSDIRKIGVTEQELQRVSLLPGDLLFVEGNGSADQIGRVALWNGQIHPCVHQNHLIKARPIKRFLGRWMLLWFMSPLGKRFVQAAASSTSGLHTLSISKIEGLPVPLPSAVELRLILARCSNMKREHAEAALALDQQSDELSPLRQSILHAAFTGRLVPQDPADEPAEALLARLRATSTPTRRTRQRVGITQSDLIETQT